MLLTPNECNPYTTMYRYQEYVAVYYKGHIKEKFDARSKSDHWISAVINRSVLDIASNQTLFESSVLFLASELMNVSSVNSKALKIRVSVK